MVATNLRLNIFQQSKTKRIHIVSERSEVRDVDPRTRTYQPYDTWTTSLDVNVKIEVVIKELNA